jgi:hypothetical protein
MRLSVAAADGGTRHGRLRDAQVPLSQDLNRLTEGR